MIVIYTEATKSIEPLMQVTQPGKFEYAERHVYRAMVADLPEPYNAMDRFAGWLQAMDSMSDGDWLFAIESDALITNHVFPAEYLCHEQADMVFACDGWGFNAGTFLLQKNPRSIRFLQNCRDWRWPVEATIEQSIMECLMTQTRRIADVKAMLGAPRLGGWPMFPSELKRAQEVYNGSSLKVRVVQQRAMNAYPRAAYNLPIEVNGSMWNPGDFVMHLPGKSMSERIEILSHHAPLVFK